MSHYVNKCKHGTIMGQCRCPGPKPTRLVACPPGHEDWEEPTIAPDATGLPCPHGRESWKHCPHCLSMTMNPTAESKERTAVVAFLREQARVALDVAASPQSAFVVVSAFLTDVADKVERGEHRG